MKKALLILVSVMLLVSLAACAPADNPDDAVAPEVKVTVTADDAGKTAADVLSAAMTASNIDFGFNDGVFDNVGGFANDTAAKAWLFYYNDQLSAVGAEDVTVVEGDVVELRYDDASKVSNTPAGDDANTPAGDDANTPAGDDANTPAGDDANTPADGDNTPAGDDANTPAGDDANTPAGDDANTPAE